MDEEIVRSNPSVSSDSGRKPAAGKHLEVPAGNAGEKAQLSLVGVLEGLAYVDKYHRKISYRPKDTVLVCATPEKRLAFAYGARPSGRPYTDVSSVVLSNFQEFNGFPVRRILESVTTRKYAKTRYLGQLTDIVYWSDKCIDSESCRSAASYHHEFEPEYPGLFVNPGELLLLEGGTYTLSRRGIVG